MFSRLFSLLIILAGACLFSCGDNSTDGKGDNATDYVFYTKWTGSGNFDPNDPAQFQMRRIDLESYKDVVLFDTAKVLGVAGDRVFYLRPEDTDKSKVRVMSCKADGSDPIKYSMWERASFLWPKLSADGKMLAYFNHSTSLNVYSATVGGQNAGQIYAFQYNGDNPYPLTCFTADSKIIGISQPVTNDSAKPHLIICGFSSDGALKMIDPLELGGFGNMMGGLSPDARYFVYNAYVENTPDSFALTVVDLYNLGVRTLSKDRRARYNLAWSPDGSMIAFQFDANDLTIIDTLGNPVVSISANHTNPSPINGLYPVWSPDGKKLLAQFSDDVSGNPIYLGNLKIHEVGTAKIKELVVEQKVLNAFFMYR